MTLVSVALISLLLYKGPSEGPEVSTVRLDLQAKSDCASRDEIIAGVAARSVRIRFVDDGAYTARVAFPAPRPGSVIAEMVVAAAGEDPAPRRVTARSCAEAVDAVALVIAVTLDPTSARKGAAGSPSTDRPAVEPATASVGTSEPSGPTAPSSSLPSNSPTDAIARLAERPPIPPKPATTVVDSPAPSADAATVAFRGLAVYAMGQSLFGPAPTMMPGVSLFALAGMDRKSVWSPAVGLGLAHAWVRELSEPGGKASFAVDAASVDLCPATVRAAVFAANPCASAMIGWTSSSGSDTAAPASSTRPFVALGGSIVVSAGLGKRLSLSARLGTGVTPIRDSYHFGASSFHRAGLLTTSASLGIGVALP
jgi:hypothetical protein